MPPVPDDVGSDCWLPSEMPLRCLSSAAVESVLSRFDVLGGCYLPLGSGCCWSMFCCWGRSDLLEGLLMRISFWLRGSLDCDGFCILFKF